MFSGSHNITQEDFCKLYDCIEKKQRKALILHFAKIKSEDEFALLDEKELFKSVDLYEHADLRAPSDDERSLIIEDARNKFT